MEFVDLNPSTAFDEAISAINNETKLVVCGSRADIDTIEDNLEIEFSIDEIIKSSKDVEFPNWFADKKKEYDSEWEMDISENEGEWPGEITEKQGFTLCRDVLSGDLVKDVVGAKVPCGEQWEILAHFNYGGWNDCPEPSVHCAIWRYWEQKYGAKIVGVSGDIVEAYVSDPPKTKEEAMELAWEQYLYCTDIVDQGMETIANLGAMLLNGNTWYFWWD